MIEEKRLAPGEVRFVVKAETTGRRTVWNVYDRVVGSTPYARPGVGKVKQGHDSPEKAQVEADRLNEKHL